MLRLGKERDVNVILGLILEFFGHTKYGHLPVDYIATSGLIRDFVNELNEDLVCILWEVNGKVTGILAGQIQTIPLLNRKVAVECLWWVEPEARGSEAGEQLLDAFEHWAKLRGADMVQMMSLPDRTGKALSRFYRRRGYDLTEVTYTKEL